MMIEMRLRISPMQFSQNIWPGDKVGILEISASLKGAITEEHIFQ
jgi:hypothetical protein